MSTLFGKENRSRERKAIFPEGSAREDPSVDELAKDLGVTRPCLYQWRTKLEAVEPGEEAARPSTHAFAHRRAILQLERLLDEKAMEMGFCT